MAKGKSKKVESSSESSESSVSESSVSTSVSSESEDSSSSSSSDNDRKTSKSSKKSTKKPTKKDTKSKSKKSSESPKKRKKKAKKDPNAPKKATTAYFYFAAKRREDYTKEDSKLSMLEKSKQIGIDWKALSDKEKAPYHKLAEEDKVRHSREKANYTAPEKGSDDSSSDETPKKRQKKEKDPNEPKRPLNPYMLYIGSQRASLKVKSPNLKPTEVTRILGEEWGKLSGYCFR
jgi:hypothetical protein